jgi:TonB family protein
MSLVNCPECGGSVSSAAPACPHCGYPRAGAPVPPSGGWPGAATPSRGVSAGWLIFGIVAVGALMLGLVGLRVYRLIHPPDRHLEELVDYVETDSAGTATTPPDPAPRADEPMPPPDDGTYELSAVEVQPVLVNNADVRAALSHNYPPLLRDAGVTGSVTLRMRVRSDGSVDAGSITVEESSHDAFSQAAAHVAERMRFRPARIGGKPVPVWVTLPVIFQLAS